MQRVREQLGVVPRRKEDGEKGVTIAVLDSGVARHPDLAAKDAFKKYDGPIPTIRELDAEFQKLVKEKNQIYSEFKIARTEMMELLSAKQNVEHFLGEQNRLEQDIQKKKGDTSL